MAPTAAVWSAPARRAECGGAGRGGKGGRGWVIDGAKVEGLASFRGPSPQEGEGEGRTPARVRPGPGLAPASGCLSRVGAVSPPPPPRSPPRLQGRACTRRGPWFGGGRARASIRSVVRVPARRLRKGPVGRGGGCLTTTIVLLLRRWSEATGRRWWKIPPRRCPKERFMALFCS